MSKKVLILTAILSVFLACQVQAAVIDSNWVSCTAGFWSDTNNWNPNVIPDNNSTDSYNVTIDTGSCGHEVEVRIRENRTINDLTIYGEVDLESYVKENMTNIVLAIVEDLDITLTLENALTNYGELEIGNLPLIIDGNIVNHSHMEVSQVDMSGNITNYNYLELDQTDMEGNVTNMPGATLEFQFPGAEINGHLQNLPDGKVVAEAHAEIKQGDVANAGLIKLVPPGVMMFEHNFSNTGEVHLYGGAIRYWAEEDGPGILDNNSTGLINGFGLIEAGSSIDNKGTIYAYGGPLSIAVDGSFINEGTLGNLSPASLLTKPAADLTNLGTIEVNAGGGFAFDCNLVNEPNGLIKLLGGTLAAKTITQSADANFAGFGSITGDVIIDPNGLIKLTGPTNIVGNVDIQENATLEISDGTTLVTGHTTNNGTIYMKGGRLIPQGGITNNGNIIWEPGLYNNMADFNLDGQVNFTDFADFAGTWLWQTAWN